MVVLADLLIEQGWTHPMLMSLVFIATAREEMTLPGCNSSAQISHKVCPGVYFTCGGFPPAP